MNCLACGAEIKTGRENFLYEASGLRGITLLGVEVRRCPECGEYEVRIPHIEDLHQAIAHLLARKAARLTDLEIRYLRKWLGWSGADFAGYMGVAAETVSRWETGAARMGGPAERLLRLMVLTREPVKDYSLEMLKGVAQGEAGPLRLGMRPDKHGWRAGAT